MTVSKRGTTYEEEAFLFMPSYTAYIIGPILYLGARTTYNTRDAAYPWDEFLSRVSLNPGGTHFFPPRVIFHSRIVGTCPVSTDFIERSDELM